MSELLHPVMPFVLGTLLVPLVGIGTRRVICLLAPAAALAMALWLPADSTLDVHLLGLDLHLLRMDAMAKVMLVAFTGYAVLAGIFAWRETAALPRGASLGLAGSGVGVVCAGDLLSMLLFWEMLAITSLFLIWAEGSRATLAAGYRYILLHLFGGLCVLVAIVMQLGDGGELTITAMTPDRPATWLLMVGVALNAGVPPLHAWLSDAYPRASVFGTVFLAAFTTKSAVYVMARLFPGAELLVWAGAAMALYGVVFAVLENDIRRLLAYHIISQVGYMVCGVGIGTGMALNGSLAHAFCHIFYKGLLMMSAGAVIYATGRGKLTELGNLARPLRWTLVFMMIGAFSISGVPLFNGFISKSMVVSAAAEAHLPTIELMLLVASMGTFLHTGLKLPWFTFFGQATTANRPEPEPVPRSMMLAMGLTAGVCVVTGLFPGLLYAALPYPAEYHPYTLDHVLTALQLLLGTALGFWLLRRSLGGQPTVTLDADRLYRHPLAIVLQFAGQATAGAFIAAEDAAVRTRRGALAACREYQHAVRNASFAQRMSAVTLLVVGLWLAFQWSA